MRVGILLIALGMVAACSSTSTTSSSAAKTAQAKEGQEGVICTYDRPTGSFLKEKKCTTPAEREAARRQEDSLVDMRNSRDSGIQ